MLYTIKNGCARLYSGARSEEVELADLPHVPTTVTSASELDLQAIAGDLAAYIKRRGRYYPLSRGQRRAARRGDLVGFWGLEVDELTPARAEELTREMRSNPELARHKPFTPAIHITGPQFSLTYEAKP